MSADAPPPHEAKEVVHRGAFEPLPFSELYRGPVWHFTDSRALVSIVENQQLWATAATMLNDPEELIYGAQRILNWYDNHGGSLPQDLPLHMQLTEILTSQFIEVIRESPAYVVCASTDYRVLNQWRNYGSTTGVAIRLNPNAELVPASPPMMSGFLLKPQWVAVAYEPEKQDERIQRVMSSIATGQIGTALASEQPRAANTLIRGLLAALAASMKDSAYSEEKEVRLISYLPEGRVPKHRGSDRGVIPYLEIQHHENFGWALLGLEALANSRAPLPIQEIRVGPPDGESERQRRIGIESLLRTQKLNVPVNGSTIRYLPA